MLRLRGLAASTVVALTLTLPGAASSGAAPGTPPSSGAVTAAAAQARVVTLVRTSTEVLPEGRKATFTGTAPTTLVGDRVTLQRRDSAGWKTVSRVKVSSRGTFSASGYTRGVGRIQWRAYGVTKVVKKRKKLVERRTYSYTASSVALRWFHLFDVKHSKRVNFARYESAIHKGNYRRSLGPRGGLTSGWAEYSLAGRCTKFRATVGQDDYSVAGSRSRFTSTVDGVANDHGVVGRKKRVGVVRDVTGRSILRVATQRVTHDGYHWGTWGNARVLCWAKP